jgi:hypothetical protein
MAVIEYSGHFAVRIDITLEAASPSTRTHSGVKTIPIGESQLYFGCLRGETIPPAMIEILCLFPYTRLPNPSSIPRNPLGPAPKKRHYQSVPSTLWSKFHSTVVDARLPQL